MSDTHESTSSSLPDLPSDNSHGSSVSAEFVNEYDEILKYAIVAPRITVEPNAYTEKHILNKEEGSTEMMSFVKNSTCEEKEVSFKVNPNYKVELKILEAKKAMEGISKEHSDIQINIPNALDSLLEYSRTPVKESTALDEPTRSSNSSPESGVCSPSNVDKVDKGLLRMDSLMDEWCLQLKRNVLAEMVDMKGKLLEDEEIAFTELKCKHSLDMQKLQHEVDSLKELLYSFEQNVKQKDEMISNLSEALNKQKEKSDKIRLFSMWRLKLNDEHRQQFASKMADKFYKKTLCTKVWAGWRGVIENKWKLRVEKACQIRSQEVCLKLTEDYEERLLALQKELSKSRADVAQMHRERELYEENMKKTFMRGVCALNMEAMTMFKESCPEDMAQTGNPHHPCVVPASDNEIQPNDRIISNGKTHTSDESESRPENPRKHVTFNTQLQYEDTSNIINKNDCRNNKKNLHVKFTGKKQNSFNSKKDKPFGTPRPSTISSIKVERHIPPDSMQQRPLSSQGNLKTNFKNNEPSSDPHSVKKVLPKTVKVVD